MRGKVLPMLVDEFKGSGKLQHESAVLCDGVAAVSAQIKLRLSVAAA
jgi:hypothetical protein